MTGPIPYARGYRPRETSIAAGVATTGDILGASWEQMLLVENTNAAQEALQRAYDERRRVVRELTGESLDDPLIPLLPDFDAARAGAIFRGELSVELDAQADTVERQRAAFQDKLWELAGRFPQHAGALRPGTPVSEDAERLAREADERLSTLMQSRPGWDKYLYSFAGGMAGSFRDPVTVGSMFLGGGVGAGRTVAARILATALSEAAINAGTEAAVQPIVQNWRRQVGLPNGFDQAAQNVAFAAILGGAIGAGGRGLAEAVRALSGGDTKAAVAALAAVRDEAPPEIRGAIDALTTDEATAGAPRASVGEEVRHTQLQARALRRAQAPETPFREEPIRPDEAQVRRVVETLAPGTAAPREAASFAAVLADLRSDPTASPGLLRPVAAYLKRQGGIDPASPIADELRAAGVTAQAFPGLYRRDGLKAIDNLPRSELPDDIRHTLPDDGSGYVSTQGFIDALARETQRTADVDVATANRQHLEEQGVDFNAADEVALAQLARADDIERRYGEAAGRDGLPLIQRTAEFARQVLRARPGSDDAFVRDATELMLDDASLDEAVRIAESNRAGVRKTDPAGNYDHLPADPPSLEDVAAMLDSEVDDSVDFKALEEAGFGDDATIPWDDGYISLAALQKTLDETAHLERVVSACKAA